MVSSQHGFMFTPHGRLYLPLIKTLHINAIMKLYVSYIRVDVPICHAFLNIIPLVEAKALLPHILIYQHIRRSFHVEFTKPAIN